MLYPKEDKDNKILLYAVSDIRVYFPVDMLATVHDHWFPVESGKRKILFDRNKLVSAV